MNFFNSAMAVFESPHYRQMDPEAPWDTYVYTMHYDRTKFLSTLRTRNDPDIAQGVMECGLCLSSSGTDCKGQRQKCGCPNSDEDCPVRDRLIADIVTVVDALDAGTDNIGRCYAAAKDFDQLVGELQSGKNTRYAPEIVRLLDDPAFYAETRQFLEENRKQVYLEVYHIKQ